MKPKSIGIIGGAGPLAGSFLLERLISISMKVYGCYRDGDFPKIVLISFPFSEMLCPEMEVEKIRHELRECLKQLRKNDASILAIACNTLHAFLDETDDLSDLVHLPRMLAEEIPPSDEPLIFCTSTSVQFGLHRKYLPCIYPDVQTQANIDEIIDQTLKGFETNVICEKLLTLIRAQSSKTVLLGCTELSLFSAHLSLSDKRIIDPLEIMANKILQKAFKQEEIQ